jgi:hypothetical protein
MAPPESGAVRYPFADISAQPHRHRGRSETSTWPCWRLQIKPCATKNPTVMALTNRVYQSLTTPALTL